MNTPSDCIIKACVASCWPAGLSSARAQSQVNYSCFPPLQKGCGYHLDLFMVGVMLGVCSLMGLPWFVAATVLSISHVNSLKLESECSAPGEQPKFLGIREQRFTGLMIFTLMGCSVFMTSVLKVGRWLFVICAFCATPPFDIPRLVIECSTAGRLNETNYWHDTFILPQFIPMPVLYGVFLYMGASSLKGIQVTMIQNFTVFKATLCTFWSFEVWILERDSWSLKCQPRFVMYHGLGLMVRSST